MASRSKPPQLSFVIASVGGALGSKAVGGDAVQGALTAGTVFLFNQLQKERDTQPARVVVEAGGQKFTFEGYKASQVCRTSRCGAAVVGGFMGMDKAGGYYIPKYQDGYEAYSNLVKADLASAASDGLALITIIAPEAAPITGPLSLVTDGISIYYAGDKYQAAAEALLGNAGGKLLRHQAEMGGFVGDNLEQIENFGSLATGGAINELNH